MLSCVNLMQPWADAIVDGALPVLVRRFPVNKKGTIGVAATNGMDGIFLETLSDKELVLAERCLEFDRAIGSVRIERCMMVPREKAWDELQEIVGIELSEFYPSHFMPLSDHVFLWCISNPVRFSRSLPLVSKGITWSVADEDSKAQRPSKRKRTFWNQLGCDRFKELNMNLRSYLRR